MNLLRFQNFITPDTESTSEKGSAIFFAVLILGFLFAIGFGISTLLVGELRILGGAGNSVIALNAGDAGVEHVLYIDIENCPASASIGEGGNYTECSVSESPCYPGCVSECVDEGSGTNVFCSATIPEQVMLSNGASYGVTITEPGTGTCPAQAPDGSLVHYCIESGGSFQESRRSIEAIR